MAIQACCSCLNKIDLNFAFSYESKRYRKEAGTNTMQTSQEQEIIFSCKQPPSEGAAADSLDRGF